MFNRTDIPIHPSAGVGLLAVLPWLCLMVFGLMLAHGHGPWFLALLPTSIAGAAYDWALHGKLCLDQSVIGLTVGADGLRVHKRNGDDCPAMASTGSRLYPTLIILKLDALDATHRPATVLLWSGKNGAGNVSGALHRQLRAWLRLGDSSGQPQQSH